MKTQLAITALLYALTSAVDLFEDDMFDDAELSDDETDNLAQTSAEIMSPVNYNGYHYTFHNKK